MKKRSGRRPDGDGSIWIDENGQRWAILSLKALTEGKDSRRLKRKVVPNTQAAAERLLDRLKNDALGGSVTKSSRLFDDVANYWIQNIKAPAVGPKTLESYDYQLQNNILPMFGKRPIDKIQAEDIDRWLQDLSMRLAEQTVFSGFQLFSQIMKFAYRRGIIQRNPVDMVDPPKVDRQAQREKRDPWTADEIIIFFDFLRGHRVYLMARLALEGTLRMGELLALTWDRIDGDTIRVDRQLGVRKGVSWRGKKTQLAFSRPKSVSGTRTIPLSAEMIELLAQHRRDQDQQGKEWRKRRDGPWNPDNLIFISKHGTALSPTKLSTEFREKVLACAEKYGIPVRPFHSLRNAGATLMSEGGASPRDIQGMLGHATAKMTLEIYARTTKDGRRKAVTALNERLAKLDKPTSEE